MHIIETDSTTPGNNAEFGHKTGISRGREMEGGLVSLTHMGFGLN